MRAPAATFLARSQSTNPEPGGNSASGATAAADSTVTSVLAVVLAALFVDGFGDSLNQGLGHSILATTGDDHTQFGFELDGAATWPAVVEMLGDLAPTFVGQLPVQVVVKLMDRFVAVHRLSKERVLSHWRAFSFSPSFHPMRSPPGRVPPPPRATPFGAPFFPDGSGSSPCRSAHR